MIVFPNNAVELIVARINTLYPELLVVKRPLKQTDLSQSVGVYPSLWQPDETSYEHPSKQPTVQRYIVKVQSFAKDTVEERGIAIHSVMAKVIRTMLYNDDPLFVGLNVLSVTMFGVTERIQRRGILRQQYMNNEISGQFLFLSTLDYYIETETK
jgi:hypothetical protein